MDQLDRKQLVLFKICALALVKATENLINYRLISRDKP